MTCNIMECLDNISNPDELYLKGSHRGTVAPWLLSLISIRTRSSPQIRHYVGALVSIQDPIGVQLQ